jgi:site-specific DNA-methyltransferase (adenine-specific)
VLPALSDEEFALLKADIAERGIAVPVVVDADSGLVVDGAHRVRAWEELRAEGTRVPDYPREVRRFASDEERLSFSVAANLFRRHLTRTQRADVVARLREMGWSLRRVSDALGVHHETVRRDLEAVAEATRDSSESPTVVGRDQKTYPARRPRPAPSIVVRSARDEARARSALAALGDEAPGTDLRRAEEKARLAALARRRAEDVPAKVEGPGWEIRTGDFREVLADIPDQSVDAIVTDPPYNVEGVPLYSDLSEFAARVLKPGRLCIAYCGKMALPEHFARLGEHLEYVWTGAIFLPGRHTVFHRKMIFGRWRPVAFFSAGPYDIRTTIVDALWAEGRGEKSPEDHPWQQAVAPFERLIEMAGKPGELIVDPFLGSGTTALASLGSGRRFLGCDIDAGAVSLSRERLQQAARPDFQAAHAERRDKLRIGYGDSDHAGLR